MSNQASLQKLYRLISIRPRSEKEIRDYFRRKEIYDDETIESSIEKLKKLRLLNDQEFAKAWVQSRSRKLGKKSIKQELFQKGIAKELIEKVMSVSEDEETIAQKLLKKKSKVWKDLAPLEFKKKAFGFLGRKGFEYSVIEKAIKIYYNTSI